MHVNLYDNQEAMEGSFFLMAFIALALHYNLLALFFFYVGLQSEDEERLLEEMELDTSDPTLSFNLGLQKDKILEYYSDRGELGSLRSASFHDYLADDDAYEREMISEIFEFPLSVILSNNYYMVPSDERHLFFFYSKIRSQLWIQFLDNRYKSLRISSLKQNYYLSPEKPLMRPLFRTYKFPSRIVKHSLKGYHFAGYSVARDGGYFGVSKAKSVSAKLQSQDG